MPRTESVTGARHAPRTAAMAKARQTQTIYLGVGTGVPDHRSMLGRVLSRLMLPSKRLINTALPLPAATQPLFKVKTSVNISFLEHDNQFSLPVASHWLLLVVSLCLTSGGTFDL